MHRMGKMLESQTLEIDKSSLFIYMYNFVYQINCCFFLLPKSDVNVN